MASYRSSLADLRRQIQKETQGLQKTPATEANVQKEDDLAGRIRQEYGDARLLVDEKIEIADRTLALVRWAFLQTCAISRGTWISLWTRMGICSLNRTFGDSTANFRGSSLTLSSPSPLWMKRTRAITKWRNLSACLRRVGFGGVVGFTEMADGLQLAQAGSSTPYELQPMPYGNAATLNNKSEKCARMSRRFTNTFGRCRAKGSCDGSKGVFEQKATKRR